MSSIACIHCLCIPVIVLARVLSCNYNHSHNLSVHLVPRAMSASSEAFHIVVKSQLMPMLLPYEFPKARVNRATRVALDCVHLRNVVWGMPCGSRARPSFDQPSFVYVENDEIGTPMIYACALCHNFIFEECTNNTRQSAASRMDHDLP